MEGCPEPLEKIFQKVEEESERRAQTERLTTQNAAESVEKSSPAKRHEDRRRGSVSISRIGQLSDDDFSSKSQPPPTPTLMTIASNSPFYQAQIANGSTNSIASGASAHSDDHAHTEDDNHVTQMQHIAGKPSISKMMPRRLSRAHSANVIPMKPIMDMEPNLVIGVSVQEATVKSAREHGDEAIISVSRRASVSVQAPALLRNKSSRTTLAGSKPGPSSWLSKARGFALKFRRKDKVSVPVVSVRPSDS